MREHALKTWMPYYEHMEEGRKLFDCRLDDRGFAEGDVLELREFDPIKNEYTGRSHKRLVIYIVRASEFPRAVGEGHCVMGLSEHSW